MTMSPGNGPLPDGVYNMPVTVSSPLLYETDLASAANAHIANNRKANRITVFIMSSPLEPSCSFVAFAVDAFFEVQFHVGRGGNWILPIRCDLAKPERPIQFHRTPHHRNHRVEAHASVTNVPRLGDDLLCKPPAQPRPAKLWS